VQTGTQLNAEQRRALMEEQEHSPIPAAAYAQAFDIDELRRLHPPPLDTEVLKALADYARQGSFSIG
jgi:hypothetical protein